MAYELSPVELHGKGLAATLAGDFTFAEDLYRKAAAGYQAERSPIDVGRVHRDLVRVYAGLDKAEQRDTSLEKAMDIHLRYADETPGLSEFAATLLVSARVGLAKHLEDPGSQDLLGQMVRDFGRAYYLLRTNEGTNVDYREQVISHGALAIAGFGRYADLMTGLELVCDPIVKEIADLKRQKAVCTARKLLVARCVGVPVQRIPGIRERISQSVAGPYRITTDE